MKTSTSPSGTGRLARVVTAVVAGIALLAGLALAAAPAAEAAPRYSVDSLRAVDPDGLGANQDYILSTHGYRGTIKVTVTVRTSGKNGLTTRTYKITTTAGKHRLTIPIGSDGADALGCSYTQVRVTDKYGRNARTAGGGTHYQSGDPLNTRVIVH